jgi:hypothetical protein
MGKRQILGARSFWVTFFINSQFGNPCVALIYFFMCGGGDGENIKFQGSYFILFLYPSFLFFNLHYIQNEFVIK